MITILLMFPYFIAHFTANLTHKENLSFLVVNAIFAFVIPFSFAYLEGYFNKDKERCGVCGREMLTVHYKNGKHVCSLCYYKGGY
jgi:hypothetical protein